MMTVFNYGIKIAHMSRTKEYYMKLFDNLPIWNDLREFEFEKETFEVTKGKVKTTITHYFNKQGYPISYSYNSELIPSEEDKLNLEIENAARRKDYARAAELQRELKEITNKTNKGEQ